MRLLRVTTLYERYLDEFYRARPGLDREPYAAQRAALDQDAFGWADFWAEALRPRGYEVMDVALNARALQRAWSREHLGAGGRKLAATAVGLAQARWFRPDVLWLDVASEPLIRAIRAEVPSVRLVLGWSGSAVTESPAWRHVDLMLSCAAEVVERFEREGLPSAQLHHGYDPRVEARLGRGAKRWDVSFVGQILTQDAIHASRAAILSRVAAEAPVAIFSPDGAPSPRERARSALLGAAGTAGRALLRAGVPERSLPPRLQRAAKRGAPRPGLPRSLRRAILPPVYGIAMYQTLADSRVTLNIHAESSPRFGSNMRLFEATGVGTCLVTDWKENMAELFEPDREAVTYRSAEELMEKLRWLLDAPAERDAIAAAGRRRVARDHTYARRAERLDALIRGALR